MHICNLIKIRTKLCIYTAKIMERHLGSNFNEFDIYDNGDVSKYFILVTVATIHAIQVLSIFNICFKNHFVASSKHH